MKIWILRPYEEDSAPWNPWYDKAFGFIVQAETEAEARALAESQAGDESGRPYTAFTGEVMGGHGQVWLNATLTSCTELTPGDTAKVIMKDFHAA